MMTTLASVFDPYIRSDWKAAFTKEVGEEHLDRMLFVIDGFSYEPYASSDEEALSVGILPKKSDKILFGEVFDLREGLSPAKELLESLQHGFDAPLLIVDASTDLTFFEGIHLDILNASVHIYDKDPGRWLDKLKSRYADKELNIRAVDMSGAGSGNGFILNFDYDPEDEVIPFIRRLFSKLDHVPDEDVCDIQVSVKMSGQFVHDVIKIRAVKIAWFNYLQLRNIGSEPFHLEIYLPVRGAYPDNVLAHTNQLVAATMAQGDTIVFDSRAEATQRRVLRNAAHIAIIEAGLERHPDPVAGSYFIEKVAADLARRAFIPD